MEYRNSGIAAPGGARSPRKTPSAKQAEARSGGAGLAWGRSPKPASVRQTHRKTGQRGRLSSRPHDRETADKRRGFRRELQQHHGIGSAIKSPLEIVCG